MKRRHMDEAFKDEDKNKMVDQDNVVDEDNIVPEGRRLKLEADREINLDTKFCKYLQSTMFFTTHSCRTEARGDKAKAYIQYNQILKLIKYVIKLATSKIAKDTDPRLVVMFLRTQSLLNLRLYKIKKDELEDYQRTIQAALEKSEEDEFHELDGEDEEGEEVKGDEEDEEVKEDEEDEVFKEDEEEEEVKEDEEHEVNENEEDEEFKEDEEEEEVKEDEEDEEDEEDQEDEEGKEDEENEEDDDIMEIEEDEEFEQPLTPPTAPPICISIPKNVMMNQYNVCSYLIQCHQLWEQADLYISKGQCKDFFILLDQESGPITLHSSLEQLVSYTRRGLRRQEVVKKERDKVANLEEAVVMLEMQVAGAGNEKMVGFLLDLIERKQKFLECPVCLEEAASPILCCPELHLVCSSCQPSLSECPECRTRYGVAGARRHRHAEGVAEELEGLREQLRQLTS